jgi:hypothetical protein
MTSYEQSFDIRFNLARSRHWCRDDAAATEPTSSECLLVGHDLGVEKDCSAIGNER